jgi:thioredoxin-related protein
MFEMYKKCDRINRLYVTRGKDMKENPIKKFLKVVGHGLAVAFKAVVHFIQLNAWIQPLLVIGVIFGLIFGLAGIPKIITSIKSCSNTTEKLEKFKNVTNLKTVDELKEQQEKDGDFIIIFGTSTCEICSNFAKSLNNYHAKNKDQKEKHDYIYYFSVESLQSDYEGDDEEKSKAAIATTKEILTPIVQKYFLESGTESWAKFSSDSNHSWINDDDYKFETPTSVFYKGGAVWNVVKGQWVPGETNFRDYNRIFDNFEAGDLIKFNEFFKYANI